MLAPTLLFRAADKVAGRLGLLDRPFQAAKLIQKAERSAASSDFGTDVFREPLGVLLDAYAHEARLSSFGRISARWDVLRLLGNLLRLREEERKNPAILQIPVTRPIFITGLPRSGTTFLHSLLAEDPANLAPRCWQTIYPYPLAGEAPTDTTRRRRLVNRQLRTFARLAPELLNVHPLDADIPQECSEINAHVFRSLRFDTTHDVASYTAWLDRTGHLEAYRFHRRFLQHLQSQFGPGKWVLKCPDHVFALGEIGTIYPDACFVFVHRDPLHILASVARLTEILRAPFTRSIDRLAIGRQVADRWVDGAACITQASGVGGIPADRIFHVRYEGLVADPIGTVASVYRHFGLDFRPAASDRIKAFIAARPHGGYGQNEYRLADFGLQADDLAARFRAYTAFFGIDTGARSRGQGTPVATA